MTRDSFLDSCKGWLIFFVVLEHCLEISSLHYINLIHAVIYSFHMPVFIFFAGMMSKTHDVDKLMRGVLKGIIIPLLVFSFFYEALWYFKTSSPLSMFLRNYSPFWILWFLFALIIWRVITPLFMIMRFPVAYSVMASLFMMQFSQGHNVLSSTRIIFFLPFFILGYKYGWGFYSNLSLKISGKPKFFALFSFLIIVTIVKIMNPQIYYGKFTFQDLHLDFKSGVMQFSGVYVTAFLGLIFIVSLSRLVTFLRKPGERSLNIYLWHGVVIYGASDILNRYVQICESLMPLFAPMVLAILLCILFSSDLVEKITFFLKNCLCKIFLNT